MQRATLVRVKRDRERKEIQKGTKSAADEFVWFEPTNALMIAGLGQITRGVWSRAYELKIKSLVSAQYVCVMCWLIDKARV